MPPPQLPRHAPRLDVLHPVEEGLLPRLGHDLDRARAHRLDRGASPGRRHRHTIGRSATARSPRPSGRHRGSGSCAVRSRARSPSLSTCGIRKPSAFSRATTALRASAVDSPSRFGGDQAVGGLRHVRLGIEHVEHLARLQAGALAHLEIVEVVARRDLHRARAEFRIGMLVGDDRDQAPGDRQPHLLADQRGVARRRSGCTATAMSASIVSGRVVATSMWPLPSASG